MSDILLDLAQNPRARKLIQSAGLPIPMPAQLLRQRGPAVERPLMDQAVLVGGKGELTPVIARTLIIAGGDPWLTTAELEAPFKELGEAYGRLPRLVSEPELGEAKKPSISSMVFDATGIHSPAELDALYAFFHPWLPALRKNARIVIIGRPHESATSAPAAAARSALEGFTRSLAKELGKKGINANLIRVEEDADDRIPGVLRFLLSPACTFVTAQPVSVSAAAKFEGDVSWVRPLAGKVALITGAARGIGAATAEIMAAEGAHVVCLDRPEDDGPASQIARKIGGSVLLADVSDPEAPGSIARALKEQHGGVDIVVHNAGVTRDKTLARMKQALWDQAIDINLAAVERITAELLKGTLRDGGRVVNLSSIAGIAGNVGQTNYAASKSGVVGLTKFLAKQVADRGITVNAIAPGFIETRLTAAIPVVIREAGRRMSALGQGGQPEDVGQAINFLCTPAAAGVTGNIIRVCGGALIGA
ncbi:MAG: 3-oxoacyl-ACP reductase [Polyangiaceae bacterium]